MPPQPLRLLQHLPGGVQPNHLPAWADSRTQERQGAPRATAQIEYGRSRGWRKFLHSAGILGPILGETILLAGGAGDEKGLDGL